ncbi:hypothetical protein [Streptomyces vinaceus]|uniref:hypothetical protein n=1 Tax=Streptomyces vinaceus TaxID=1960 RepID=UPI0036B762D5
MFDRDRQAHGRIVALYPSPLVARLADTPGVQWIARTVAYEPAPPPPAAARAAEADRDEVRVPAGRSSVDVPPTELRVGDQALAGGRLVGSHGPCRGGPEWWVDLCLIETRTLPCGVVLSMYGTRR